MTLGGETLKKCFNVNGPCYSDENYMVNLDERMIRIKELVDKQKYFVINRARQYGKTTTLWALRQYLKEEYNVLSTNFQRMSSAVFYDEHTFSREFAHGFAVLSEEAVVQYKCDDYYMPQAEGGISFDDPELAIDWKIPREDMVLSPKDLNRPGLRDAYVFDV